MLDVALDELLLDRTKDEELNGFEDLLLLLGRTLDEEPEVMNEELARLEKLLLIDGTLDKELEATDEEDPALELVELTTSEELGTIEVVGWEVAEAGEERRVEELVTVAVAVHEPGTSFGGEIQSTSPTCSAHLGFVVVSSRVGL